MDAKSGCVFCLECDDFIYDASFTNLHTSVEVMAEERFATFQGKVLSCTSVTLVSMWKVRLEEET